MRRAALAAALGPLAAAPDCGSFGFRSATCDVPCTFRDDCYDYALPDLNPSSPSAGSLVGPSLFKAGEPARDCSPPRPHAAPPLRRWPPHPTRLTRAVAPPLPADGEGGVTVHYFGYQN